MSDYVVIYEQGEAGDWGAYSPDVPGCVAAGASQEEVERLMREAIPDHLDLLRETGAPLPAPRHRAGSITA